jgi:hypothetical protein
MARGTRETIITHADQAINDLKRASDNLELIRDLYAPVHPEYAGMCQLIIDSIFETARVLIQIRDEKM